MNEYKEYKLSELFQLLENNKIIEMKNENGFIAFIKYDDKANLLIKYRDSTNWCWLQDSANHLVKNKFRVIKTIEGQIEEILQKHSFFLGILRLEENHISLAKDEELKKLDVLRFSKTGISFYTASLDKPSHTYSLELLTELYEIFENNNYSFEEEIK